MRTSTVRADDVYEGTVGIYGTAKYHVNDWFRIEPGLRADGFAFDVESDDPANSGDDTDGIVSPTLNLVFGPWADTEYYVSAGTGFHSNDARDVTGEVQPIAGLAAAVGVNFGPALSYVFDTTECRLLYAWQGGFVDMTPYWGDSERGSRQSFDYVPRLVGTLFWKASGKDPIELDGKSISETGARTYIGYRLEKGVPVFDYRAGDPAFTKSTDPLAYYREHLDEYNQDRTYAAVEIPHKEMNRSAGEPMQIPAGAPFAGQMILPDNKGTRVTRLMLEKIGNVWQGGCTHFINDKSLGDDVV